MIISPINPPEWDSDDATILKEFLSTKTGSRLQEIVAFNCPPFEDGSDVNKTLVAAGKREGYEESFCFWRSLVTFQPEQPEQRFQETYPNLDDESKWDDDNKPQDKTD